MLPKVVADSVDFAVGEIEALCHAELACRMKLHCEA
jgi:hypothetical protein